MENTDLIRIKVFHTNTVHPGTKQSGIICLFENKNKYVMQRPAPELTREQ